jgi:hypothetical protein
MGGMTAGWGWRFGIIAFAFSTNVETCFGQGKSSREVTVLALTARLSAYEWIVDVTRGQNRPDTGPGG